MEGVRTLLAVALALGAATACQAETVLETDFARGLQGWARNGTARLVSSAEPGREQVLQMTSSKAFQVGVVWTELRRRVPSFSFIVEARVRFTPGSANECPADGFALVFAPVETDAMGSWGGSLGLCGNQDLIRQFVALEVNTWRGQGLGTPEEQQDCRSAKNETFALDVLTPEMRRTETARATGGGTPQNGGFKIGQTLAAPGMAIVNGGWYRYQWNVDLDGTTALYVTGLEDANRGFQNVKVLEVKMAWNPLDLFDGRWGLTATTGGAVQTTEVSRIAIEVPMVEPR
jgi:Bacterial lectin